MNNLKECTDKKILIIDDNSDVSQIVKEKIKNLGYEIVTNDISINEEPLKRLECEQYIRQVVEKNEGNNRKNYLHIQNLHSYKKVYKRR